jgi:hypothetical protein
MASEKHETSLRSSMLDACYCGDIATLQRLFADNGIEPGSKPIHRPGIPHALDLLERAAEGRKAAVVKFILDTYPSLSLCEGQGVASAVINNPDTDVLQLLLDHQPNFASLTMDYHMFTFLTEACSKRSADIVPVIHLLVDSGGDVNEGWGPTGGALYAAFNGQQPLEVIAKIVDKGGFSPRHVFRAIQQRRADALELLLNHKWNRLDDKAEQEIKEFAERSADKEIIAIVQAWSDQKARRAEQAKASTFKRCWRKLLGGRMCRTEI